MKVLSEFEKSLGYVFKNKSLLKTALTHSSYANEHRNITSNERLEFLGDSVLGLIVSENLYRIYPNHPEGELSKIKSAIVREESLAIFAARLRIDQFILLGKGEEKSGGKEKNSILADCYEAVLGGIYLDSNFENAKIWLDKIIKIDAYSSISHIVEDYKTKLQELAQETPGSILEYVVINQKGPAHHKTFDVEVLLDNKVIGKGSGSSKKSAEQEAAKNALIK